ncbi:MAG: putative glycoside hydrolase, partial [Patescibacteria group bacterium]
MNKPYKILFYILILLISLAFTIKAVEAKKIEFPKLASYYFDSVFSNEEIETLAKFDLIILTMESSEYSKKDIKAIRDLNPEIIILPYVPSQSFNDYSVTDTRANLEARINDGWYLRDSAGNKIVERGKHINEINITKQGWRRELVDFVDNELLAEKCGQYDCWDGVFYDMVDKQISWLNNGDIDLDQDGVAEDTKTLNKEWRRAYKKMMKRTRNKIGNKKLIIVNGASTKKYQKYINGRMYEHFPESWGVGDQTWLDIMEDRKELKKKNYKPVTMIIAADGNENDYKQMRYGFASHLIGKNYFTYDDNAHHKLWWYDEYDAFLGRPLGPAYNLTNPLKPKKVKKGVWRRDFEYGTVILNSTKKKRKINLETGFEKINGNQDPKINNGNIINQVTVKKRDGIVLLGRLSEIRNAPFL